MKRKWFCEKILLNYSWEILTTLRLNLFLVFFLSVCSSCNPHEQKRVENGILMSICWAWENNSAHDTTLGMICFGTGFIWSGMWFKYVKWFEESEYLSFYGWFCHGKMKFSTLKLPKKHRFSGHWIKILLFILALNLLLLSTPAIIKL